MAPQSLCEITHQKLSTFLGMKWPYVMASAQKNNKTHGVETKLGKKHEIHWKMPSDTGSTNIKRATPPLSITHPAGWMTIVWNIHHTQQTGDGTWNLASQLNVLGYGPCCGSKSTVFVAAASIFVSFVWAGDSFMGPINVFFLLGCNVTFKYVTVCCISTDFLTTTVSAAIDVALKQNHWLNPGGKQQPNLRLPVGKRRAPLPRSQKSKEFFLGVPHSRDKIGSGTIQFYTPMFHVWYIC